MILFLFQGAHRKGRGRLVSERAGHPGSHRMAGSQLAHGKSDHFGGDPRQIRQRARARVYRSVFDRLLAAEVGQMGPVQEHHRTRGKRTQLKNYY